MDRDRGRRAVATLLTVGIGDVPTVAELFGAFEVADLLDQSGDLGFVADGRLGALRIGELTDPGDEAVSLSAGLAVRDASPNARDDIGGDAHG